MRKRDKKAKNRISPNPAKEAKSYKPKPGRVLWSFAIFDSGMQWGCDKAANEPFRTIAKLLKEFESMPWGEIKTGSRYHAVAAWKLCKQAKDRLVEIQQDDAEELWGFRFGGKQRLWGIELNDTFQVLWWDPEHEVCPSKRKNT